MLEYKLSKSEWKTIWTNNSNGKLGPWMVNVEDQFLIGDFNGDGKDDVLCIQNTNGEQDWWSIINFINNEWKYLTPNSFNGGNDWFGPWKLRVIDEFYVGDFNGDGKDDVLCIQKTDNEEDWFSILTFDSNNSSWKYLYIDEIPITNYGSDYLGNWKIRKKDKIYVGDFDGDGKSEIIFSQNYGTQNDFIALYKLNSSNFERIWCNCDNGIYVR